MDVTSTTISATGRGEVRFGGAVVEVSRPFEGWRVLCLGRTLASSILLRLVEDFGAEVWRCATRPADRSCQWDDRKEWAAELPMAEEAEDWLTQDMHRTLFVIRADGGSPTPQVSALMRAICAALPSAFICELTDFPAAVGLPEMIEPDHETLVAASLGLVAGPDGHQAPEPLPLASTYAAATAVTELLLLERSFKSGHSTTKPSRVSLLGSGVVVLSSAMLNLHDDSYATPGKGQMPPIAAQYRCGGGRYIQINGRMERAAKAVTEALGHPEWTELAMAGVNAVASPQQNREMTELLAGAFLGRTAFEWEDRIADLGGAATVCRSQEEWMSSAEARDSGMAIRADSGDSVAGPAISLTSSGSAAVRTRLATDSGPWRLAGSGGLPLDGVKVLDMSIVLAGPTCGRLLGEYGADVIKVDSPARSQMPYLTPDQWLDCNRTKRSVLLDISTEDGARIFEDLLATADVLLENFRADVLGRLGYSWERIRAINPEIVYTSLNAFDFGARTENWPGWDSNGQAISGMESQRSSPEGVPQRLMVPALDYGTALFGCMGTVAALRERDLTGLAQRVRGSLARTATFLQLADWSWRADDRRIERPVHGSHEYDFLQCTDGIVVTVRPRGGDDLADLTNMTKDQALSALRSRGISAVEAVPRASLRDSQMLRDAGYLRTWLHPRYGPTDHIFGGDSASGVERRVGWPASDPGGDTGDVLTAMGYGVEKISRLKAREVVRGAVRLFA